MKLRYQILIGILLAFIQGILLNFFGDSNFLPNIILVITIVGFFVERDIQKWIVIAWTAAIARDISLSVYIGCGAISILLTIWALYFLSRWINNENLIGVLIEIILGTVLYNSFYWIILAIIGSTYSYLYAFNYWIYQMPINALLGIIIYYFMRKRAKEKRRKERFRYY